MQIKQNTTHFYLGRARVRIFKAAVKSICMFFVRNSEMANNQHTQTIELTAPNDRVTKRRNVFAVLRVKNFTAIITLFLFINM